MKKVLLALALIAITSTASAFEVVTGVGTPNAVVVDGTAYAIPINRICGMATFKAGVARYEVGRDGKYVTIGGMISRIVCAGGAGGGGGSAAAYHDEWKDSDLVDDEGNVSMNPGETTTDHPSTDPADSGFDGDGPPSIDG